MAEMCCIDEGLHEAAMSFSPSRHIEAVRHEVRAVILFEEVEGVWDPAL